MNATTKIATVTVETAHAQGNVLHAGTYRVEMPSDYDPSAVTGEDILCDGSLRIVDDEDEEIPRSLHCYAETCDGVVTVVDPNGGRWWPSDEAAADIAASADPIVRALSIADHEPMRGEWRS